MENIEKLERSFALKRKRFNVRILLLLLFLTTAGCEKDFLETKPNKALLVPQTLVDFQRLMDNTVVMNTVPSLALISADEFYADQNAVSAWLTLAERNSYVWADDIFGGQSAFDWNNPYQQVFYSNIVLEGLEQLSEAERNSIKALELKGSALFYRAHAYFWLAQYFCPPYQTNGNGSLLGLPLKLHADISEKVTRSNLTETYEQIKADLKSALTLLPAKVDYKNRPSKQAAKGLLARLCLFTLDYDKALSFADDYLKENSKLFDFNTLNATNTSTANPFPNLLPNANDEVVFYASPAGYSFFNNSLRVDSTLYRSYINNDLRKLMFFVDRGNGQVNIKGDFAGPVGAFNGIANGEMYFIRAECYARAGNANAAMNDLNSVLVKRFRAGTYVILTAANSADALSIILAERRKDMIRRGLRWSDLRRLNQDNTTSKTIEHRIGQRSLLLEPKSLKYTFPIPQEEIIQGGITQNPR